MDQGPERRTGKRSGVVLRRLLRAATLGSATMGLMLVLYTGASVETLTVTALTLVLYLAWWLAGSSDDATDAHPR